MKKILMLVLVCLLLFGCDNQSDNNFKIKGNFKDLVIMNNIARGTVLIECTVAECGKVIISNNLFNNSTHIEIDSSNIQIKDTSFN